MSSRLNPLASLSRSLRRQTRGRSPDAQQAGLRGVGPYWGGGWCPDRGGGESAPEEQPEEAARALAPLL